MCKKVIYSQNLDFRQKTMAFTIKLGKITK